MQGKAEESSPSGQRIIRYSPSQKPFQAAYGNEARIELISKHVREYVGKTDLVLHEILSDLVHIDIIVVPPSDSQPYITLVTCGMSAKPMAAPAGYEHLQFGELMLSLPPEWPLSEEALKDENNYWPLRWLRTLARFPHEYDTWLSYGHTIPNGDPPEPFAENTDFCGFFLSLPRYVNEDFCKLEVDEKTSILIYSLFPIYREEMDLKLRRGTAALEKRLIKFQVSELLDLSRPNLALIPWWKRLF